MKNTRTSLSLAVVVGVLAGMMLLSVQTASAQRYLTSVNYSMGFATGRMSEYVPGTSFSGMTIDIRYMQQDRTFFGLALGWHYYSDLMRNALSQVGSSTVYGSQVRTVNTFPILASAGLFLDDGSSNVHPYAALNVGTYSINQRLEIGLVQINNNNWHFGVAPEVGMTVDVDRNTTFHVQTRYNYALSSGTALNGSSDNSYGWWDVNIGFAFAGW